MKQPIVRVAIAVWLIGLVLSGFLPSIPLASVPIFNWLAFMGLIPLVPGTRRYQIFGIAAVAGSLMLAGWEHEAGLRETADRERFDQMRLKRNSSTNSATTHTSPAAHE
jgi:hypothetical protein